MLFRSTRILLLSLCVLLLLLLSVPGLCLAQEQEVIMMYSLSETQLTKLEQNSQELKTKIELLQKLFEMSGQNLENLLPVFSDLLNQSRELKTRLQLSDSKLEIAEKNLTESEKSLQKMMQYIDKLEKQAVEAVKRANKSWEIGAGLGSHNGDLYIPVQLQHNTSPYTAWSFTVHANKDFREGFRVDGWDTVLKFRI